MKRCSTKKKTKTRVNPASSAYRKEPALVIISGLRSINTLFPLFYFDNSLLHNCSCVMVKPYFLLSSYTGISDI